MSTQNRTVRRRWPLTLGVAFTLIGIAIGLWWFRLGAELAADAGLDRGAYHFFTFCAPAAAQARNFLTVAAPDAEALPPAVDLELAGNCRSRPDQGDVDRELDTFLSIVEEAWGRKALLYVGDDWERRYPVRRQLGRPLWHRRFLLRPDVGNWMIWQLHGYARVSGVDGQVDLNVMRPVG